MFTPFFVFLLPDPARVVNMPSVIYAAISLPGFIRCPVDANPPVTLVKWKKDGLPLRIEKVGWWAYRAYLSQTETVRTLVEGSCPVSYKSSFGFQNASMTFI